MSQPVLPTRLFCPFRLAIISLQNVAKLVPGLFPNSYLVRVHLVELNLVAEMMRGFCRFWDFAVPLLGLSTRDPCIHQMHATPPLDSSFRAPHFPDAAGIRPCLGVDDFTIYSAWVCLSQRRVIKATIEEIVADL
jgi:hypothetical protein